MSDKVKITLFAYRPMGLYEAPCPMPAMSEQDLIEIAKGSKASAKSNGERLHPCLVPRCNRKGGDLSWLVRTVDLGQA